MHPKKQSRYRIKKSSGTMKHLEINAMGNCWVVFMQKIKFKKSIVTI